MHAIFELSGKKSLYVTTSVSPNELRLTLIEETVRAKIRDVLQQTNGTLEIEIRECDSIESELERQKAILGVASFSIAPDDNICSFLSVFEDAIWLVVLCEIRSGKQTVIDELLKHIKDPRCLWSGDCVVDGEESGSTRDEDVFLLGVSRIRFDFRIEHQPNN